MTAQQIHDFIISKKLSAGFYVNSEMKEAFLNDTDKIKYELFKSLLKTLYENRVNDINISEGVRFFDDSRYELELFVFNREELMQLVQSIKMNAWTPIL